MTVDGLADSAITSSGATQSLEDATISRTSDDSYRIVWSSGEALNLINRGGWFDVDLTLGPNDGAGSVQGLLGANSGVANDFQLPDGTVLAQPLSEAELLGAFADGWRVHDGASLLGADSLGASGVRCSAGSVDGQAE